jgi:pyruvate formate lyase activating enzyme
MKGCPMKCFWCHNPEGISPAVEFVERTDKVGDMLFTHNEIAGKSYSVSDILSILESDRPFISESKGGVTFSGGEPMMQREFLAEVLRACKENEYHTAIDTSGYSSQADFMSVIPYTDLFLFDIKHLDESKHVEFTGVSNKEVIENYNLILSEGTDMMVRLPVIPGFNDDNDHLYKLKDYINSTKNEALKMINLIPFHKTGSSKYRKLNLPDRMNEMETPTAERMSDIKELFSQTGIKVKIGG